MKVHANSLQLLWEEVSSDLMAALQRVGSSGHWILGPEVAKLESQLAVWFGHQYAVGCASGLDALELALRALGIRAGDLVLTTPISAFATTLAVLKCGAHPVFVDTDEWGALDLEQTEHALKDRPEIKWLLPVHLYGKPLDMAHLRQLRSRYEVQVIEDCAQSIGAHFQGIPAGSVADLAVTSFYPTKNLGTLGDGGAILSSRTDLDQKLRSLRDYGQSSKYVHTEFGLNSRLDELHAAFLQSAFMPRLKTWISLRGQIASRYLSEIKNPKLRLPVSEDRTSLNVYHLFPIRVAHKLKFMEFMKSRDIVVGEHYPTLIPDQPLFQSHSYPMSIIGTLSRARAFVQEQVSLPIHPYLTESEVSYVIQSCNNYTG